MATIDSKKLLPPSKKGGAIEKQKFLVPIKSIATKNISDSALKPVDKNENEKGGSLVVVKKQVIQLRNLINNSLLLDRSETSIRKKEEERNKAEQKEKKLEEKVKKNNVKTNLLTTIPGQSIFDTINRFIGFTLLGYLFNKYGELLPKLIEFGRVLEPVGKFFETFAKNLLESVIKFIDLGYKAYDGTRDLIKKIGGKNAEKTFNEFSNNLNLVLNGAIAAAMLIASTKSKTPGGAAGSAGASITKSLGGTSSKAVSSFGAGQRYGANVRQLGRAAAGGTFESQFSRKGVTLTEQVAAQRAAKQVATQGVKSSSRFAITRAPVIGALIGFIIDTVIFREKPTRAAAGAVGNLIGSGIGAALAGAGTFGIGAGLGLVAGGFIGDLLGKTLYDVIVGYGTKPIQARAEGGSITKGGQSAVNPSRRLKAKTKKVVPKIIPQRTEPGKNIGGKLKIEELYGTDEPGKRSALRALKKSSEEVKKVRSLNGLSGAMFGAGIDMALGQKPDKKLAYSLGNMFGSVVQTAIDSELNSSFNDISKTLAMANGGVVPSREIGRQLSIGERIGKFISSALAISIESSASRILQNLNKELNLDGGPPGDIGLGGPDSEGGGPDVFHGMGAERMWNFFKNKGLSDIAVAGILGNARWESSFNPAARGKGMGPGGSDAIGIFQWGETARWKNLVNWSKQQNLNPWDYDTQLKFAWYEMQTSEKATIPALQGATSAADAAEKFRAVYERSRHTEQRRKDAAEGYYKQFKGKMYVLPQTLSGKATSYKPPSPGFFNAIQYITGDSTQGANYDQAGHGGKRYHEHIAFKTIEDKERAKAALRAAGFTIGSEYRRGDPGYHGSGLAIDVPFYPNNRLGYSDDKKGEQRFSKDVRKILGIGSSGPSKTNIKQNDQRRASLAPTQSSTVASLNKSGLLNTDTSVFIIENNSIALQVIEKEVPVV